MIKQEIYELKREEEENLYTLKNMKTDVVATVNALRQLSGLETLSFSQISV